MCVCITFMHFQLFLNDQAYLHLNIIGSTKLSLLYISESIFLMEGLRVKVSGIVFNSLLRSQAVKCDH